MKCGEIIFASGERALIPLPVYDQLLAWNNDPNGSAQFFTPPVDLNGRPVQLRIHRTSRGFIVDGAVEL